MIDLIKAKKLFDEYVSNYDMDDKKVKQKYYHSLRVSSLCKEIANSLHLSQEEQDIASLMGLLHDIGRFNQIKIYHTYDDRKSINHGVEGFNVLKKDNYISQYVEDIQIQDMVLKTVINHNKTFIDKDLNEKEVLFANIVRDADKLDIYSIWVNDIEFKHVDEKISKNIAERVLACKIDYEEKQSDIDHYILEVGLVYDINFEKSYQIIKKEDYINKIIDKIEEKNIHEKDLLEKIRKVINNYLGGKIC